MSSTAPTRRLYRTVANRIGGRRRARGPLPEYYANRVRRFWEIIQAYPVIGDGGTVLDLGTGWLHWEALTVALFFDIRAVLFDVWDSRQLGGMKNYLRQLRAKLVPAFIDAPDAVLAKARARLDAAVTADSFEQLYRTFGFTYVTDPSGLLGSLADQSIDFVFSTSTLEHVRRGLATALIRDTYRVLKPGGWAFHGIDIADHLAYYDGTVSPKLYLALPEWSWKAFGENGLQYMNRLQRSEWMALFRSAGFEVVNERVEVADIGPLTPAAQYRHMSPDDLSIVYLELVLRRPPASAVAPD